MTDAVDPGLQGRLAAEVADGAEDAEEDFLGEVEGLVAVAQQVQGELIDHALVTGDQLGTRRLFARGATLDERRLAVADFSPTECPGVFHDGFGDNSKAHSQCIKIRTRLRPKVPRPFATIVAVRRTLVAVVFVAMAGVAGALAYSALANEREFERLMAEGDQAVAADRHFQAIEAYSGAIALKPDSMLAHLKRGAVYQSQSEFEAALRDLRGGGGPRSERSAGDRVAGRRQHLPQSRANGPSNATRPTSPSTNAMPGSITSLDCRAIAPAGSTPAAAALQQALKLDPALGEAHYVLGLVLRDQNKLPAAQAIARGGRAPVAGEPDGAARGAGRGLRPGGRAHQGHQRIGGPGGPRRRAAPIASWRSAWRRPGPAARTRRSSP